MKVLGLTGGIACGKSTVAAALEARGIPVIDVDEVARKIVEPGQPALAEIVSVFGEDVLHDDGSLNREALGAIVFADEDKRKQLEAITHPQIRLSVAEAIQSLAEHPVVIVDAALMIETGWATTFPHVIVVWCEPDQQVARIVARDGISGDDARKRLSAQMPIDRKRALGDFALDNSGPPEALAAEVGRLVAWIENLPV